MIYDGAADRRRLTALREALTTARDRTELDPFDEAMFNAVSAMLEMSELQSAAVERLQKSGRKLERRLR